MTRPESREPAPSPVLEAGAAVPMRDGVILRADIRRPAGPGPFPALILRTPYGRASDPDELRFALRAVARGYAVMLQDVRGRHGSGGLFDPHKNEGRDGFDSIEWLAAREWCDGRVGSFGLSYPGSAQWFAALLQPPHLLAMAPAMTFASLREAVWPGGAFDMDWLRWALVDIAPDLRARANLPGPRTTQEAWEEWERRGPAMLDTLPLAALPELDSGPEFLRQWLAHPPEDPWWDFGDLAGGYERVTAAALHLAGWSDDAFTVAGAVANHQGLVAARAKKGEAPPRSLLVLGPWGHGVNAVTGDAPRGDRDFGPQARLDYDGLVLDFMDLHVRGLHNRLAEAAPVRCFVMGANRWREDAAWPPDGLEERALYLCPGADGRGALLPAPPEGGPAESSFWADPARPLREVPVSELGARDGLPLFETAPFEAELTVLGPVRAEIFLSTDAPDLDLCVRLFDVAPQAEGEAEGGGVFELTRPNAGVLRASLRHGLSRRAPLASGRAHRLVFDGLLTANAFLPGHRLRVVLCASRHPLLSRNPQTGASEVVSAQTRPARIAVLHGPEQPSRLVLPVPPQSPPAAAAR